MDCIDTTDLSYIKLSSLYIVERQSQVSSIVKTFSPEKQHIHSWKELGQSLKASRNYLSKKNPEQVAIAHGDIAITWGKLLVTVKLLESLLDQLDNNPELLAKYFQWVRPAAGTCITGYYEPVIRASRTVKKGYAYPLYKVPPDLHCLSLGIFNKNLTGQSIVYRQTDKGLIPYYSRQDIEDKGVLKGKGLEIAWLADPLDAYFLHIQGSGLLAFDDGTFMHARFAGNNGLPYHSLVNYLEEQGIIPEGSKNVALIRTWIEQNPSQLFELLHRNKRYVFFELYENGPVGSIGVPLIPWISISIDRTVFPMGSVLAFTLHSEKDWDIQSPVFCGLGVAQDSGGVSGSKIDIFCGSEQQAYRNSSLLYGMGNTWILLAK